VRVGTDLDRTSATNRRLAPPPVEVEAVRVGVELEGDAGRGGLVDDGVEIDGVRVSREQKGTARAALR
jgi:hypothetical protein